MAFLDPYLGGEIVDNVKLYLRWVWVGWIAALPGYCGCRNNGTDSPAGREVWKAGDLLQQYRRIRRLLHFLCTTFANL